LFRFTIRDVLWLMVVVGVALSMWLGWSRDAAALRKAIISEKEVAAERDKVKKQFTALASRYSKLLVKSRLQDSALEHFGVKADGDAYRIVPIKGSKDSNQDTTDN